MQERFAVRTYIYTNIRLGERIVRTKIVEGRPAAVSAAEAIGKFHADYREYVRSFLDGGGLEEGMMSVYDLEFDNRAIIYQIDA